MLKLIWGVAGISNLKLQGLGSQCAAKFQNLFPTSLSGFTLSGCDSGGSALSASVSFPVKGGYVITNLAERSRDQMGWCVGAE